MRRGPLTPVHPIAPQPECVLVIPFRPAMKSPSGTKAYRDAVVVEARKAFPQPLTADDLEVHLVHSSRNPKTLVDMDNALSPTLDALEGVAYVDDRQVQTVLATRVDLNKDFRLSGPIDLVLHLDAARDDTTLILIYSEAEFVRRVGAQLKARRGAGSQPEPAQPDALTQAVAAAGDRRIGQGWGRIPEGHRWSPPDFEKHLLELVEQARGAPQTFIVEKPGPPRMEIYVKGSVQLAQAEIEFDEGNVERRAIWEFHFELPAEANFWPVLTTIVQQLGKPVVLTTTGQRPQYPRSVVIELIACWLA